MVDLPGPSRNQESIVTSQAPQPQISGTEVAQPWQMLGNALDKAGEGLEQVAKPLAERAGLQAVSRDADGNLQITHAPIFGDAGAVFARATKFSALAEGEAQAKRDDIGLRQQYQYNPEGYQRAANSYRDKMVKQYTDAAGPEVGISMGRAIDTSTTWTYRSLVLQQQGQIRQNFNLATNSAIESKTNDLADLIATGGANSPQARALAGEIHQIMHDRTTNPLLNEPQEVYDLRAKELDQKIGAAHASYQAGQILKGQSPYQGLINDAGNKYGVNPIILTRQLMQESGLNPEVQPSKAGAQGIAQFMPETAVRYGVDVHSVPSSIDGAARYMSDLQTMFGGNAGLALAAYNWGEGHVAAWMASGANPQTMPTETRNYVRAITGQPIEAWARGDNPSVSTIQNLGAGIPIETNIRNALRLANSQLSDDSLPVSQRLINYNSVVKTIKDFQLDVERGANISAKMQKEKDESIFDSVIKDSANDKPQWTENSVKNSDASPEAKVRMLAFLKRDGLTEPPAQLSEATAGKLLRRMQLPEGDPQKITSMGPLIDALTPTDGSRPLIRRSEFDWLVKHFNDDKTPDGQSIADDRKEFFHRYGSSIDPSIEQMGQPSAAGQRQMYLAEKDARQQEDTLRAQGKDPHLVYDPRPGNEYFFGKEQNIAKYNKSLQTKLHDTVNPGMAASYQDIPATMSPTDVMKTYQPGTRIRLPDGRIGTVPWPNLPIR
jgi:soluble lytic murein transglycosylase-like protein